MQISKQRILGLLVLPAVVLAGLVLLRLVSNSHAPVDAQPNAWNKDTSYQAETATPSLPPLAQSASPAAAAAASSVSAPSPAPLWAAPGETTGEKLDPKSASYAKARREGVKPKGRLSPFDPGSLTPLAALRRGDNVVIPLLGGEQVTGKVNLVQQEAGGWVRVGGELTGPRPGSFSLGSSGKNAGGTILLPQEQIAYAITGQPDGLVVMQEKPLSDVICFPIPRPENEPATAVRSLGLQEALPILSSRPAATAVLYLDFDGETVTDPSWNSGNTIVAQPSSLTSAQIAEVWNRVKEDYWPFNIDVTTDRNRYNSAPVGSRMRCIITPTDTAAPGAGGVACLDSFDRAGSWFSSTIPCWVFNSSVVGVAEAVSHELGHTFGLHHDGRTSPAEEYYAGHGTGAVGWGPIMGAAYTKSLVQWSKGEYASANNQEDDLAIIANAANGFGYVADDAGNSRGSAAALNAPGGAVNQTGIISGNNDVDFYVFTVGAGVVSINANPASISPNLDILLQLQNSAGTVVASSNPDTALNASVSYTVAAGTYYITVQGTGRGAVLGDGYSNYGSIGHYSLSGTVPLIPPTITTQPLSQTVAVGSNVAFSVAASGYQPFWYQWKSNGVSIFGAAGATYTISNVQTSQAGNYTVVVSNAGGSATSATAELTVNVPPSITAQPQSQTVTAGNSVAFSVTSSGTTPLSYQWYRNNTAVAGATAASYTTNATQPNDAGDYKVRVSNVAGSVDSAAATLTVQYAPVITQQPQSQNRIAGESVTLVVVATGVPAPTYLWKFNGTNIPGATSTTYTFANFQPANAGSYAVVVSNSLGSVTSSSAVLAVAVCAPAPSGLVGWWPGEGNATDIAGGVNGTVQGGVGFAAGKVGQAFNFDGIASYIRIADTTNLRFTNALTIEAWIYPTSVGTWHNIVSKWNFLDPLQTAYTTVVVPDGRIALGVCASGDQSVTPVVNTVSTNYVRTNQWTHFAATYDGSALRMYINGVCEDQVAYSQGIFPGNEALAIGAAGAVAGGQVVSPFAGLIDEPAVYNRALSASEIAALYNTGSAGKCSLPPTVFTQPANQTVIVGDIATFTVGAGGTPALSYQWRFNGADIPTAMSASLALTNLQLSQAGNYDVIVSNNSGSVTSAVATLIVGTWAHVHFDFETAATSPVWLGATQMVQNTSASHQGTNAIAFTGTYPDFYILTELPQGTTNVEFFFYDDYGPNPPLYQYMSFWLLEATNAGPFAGFMMLDGGWGTTPPMTMNHYYAFGNEEYSASTMGPLRTIGWHKFTFAMRPESVALSVDGTLVFQTNMIRTPRYLKLALCDVCAGWGRMDDLVLTGVTVTQPTLTVSRADNGIRLAWPVSASGFVLQETISPPGNWTNSSAAVVVQGNENVAMIATTGTPKLYRLRK